MPIADFTESLFNNQNVDLVSVTIDRVNMESDGQDLLMKLLNVPDLKIKNSRIIIPILNELQLDEIRCLEITSSLPRFFLSLRS